MSKTVQLLTDCLILLLILAGHVFIYYHARQSLGRSRARVVLLLLGLILLGATGVIGMDHVGSRSSWNPPPAVGRTLSFAAGIWVFGSAGVAVLLFLKAAWDSRTKILAKSHPEPQSVEPSRREFLHQGVVATAALSPYGVAAWGALLVRSDFELREVDFPVNGLPPDLEGLRAVLLTDIHFGPYLSLPELERVIAMANETRPHVALVTGDLITRATDPLDTCLIQLSRLRAEAGIFGCLGNHEQYARCQDFVEQRGRRLGLQFLRGQAQQLQFGGSRLNLAGVDYQPQRQPYLLGAEGLLEPGAVNLLMSHNPDVFPVAAHLGYDLVVGGHTHGGQVTVEILEQSLNVGRFFTPFVAGLYRRGPSSLYVSRGIGTINLPIRLGARPEVSLLKLRRV